MSKNKDSAIRIYNQYVSCRNIFLKNDLINDTVWYYKTLLKLLQGCSKKMYIVKKNSKRQLKILKKVDRMISQKEKK